MSIIGYEEFGLDDLAHIVRNMRARDRAEIYPLRWDDDEDSLIVHLFTQRGPLWRLWREEDGTPLAMSGVIPLRPNVCTAFAFGTEHWPQAVRPILRWGRYWAMPRVQAAGYHRGEAYALAGNNDVPPWIAAIGGKPEAYLHGYGKNGEDYILYAWRLTDVFRWGPRQQRPANGLADGHRRERELCPLLC